MTTITSLKGQEVRPVSKREVISLGESKLVIEKVDYGKQKEDWLFVNLHDNEATSVSAATDFLRSRGGSLVKINNNGKRFLAFRNKKRLYYADPNRMFSESGRIKTLKTLSARFHPVAEQQLQALSDFLTKNYIDSTKILIALHNNTDGKLSIETYVEKQALVHMNPQTDPDNFILTTDSLLFEQIAQRNINVVWEDIKKAEDDGSLSIYAGKRKILYLNIEAEHEQIEEQCSMLILIDEILKGKKEKSNTASSEPDKE